MFIITPTHSPTPSHTLTTTIFRAVAFGKPRGLDPETITGQDWTLGPKARSHQEQSIERRISKLAYQGPQSISPTFWGTVTTTAEGAQLVGMDVKVTARECHFLEVLEFDLFELVLHGAPVNRWAQKRVNDYRQPS